MISKRAFLHSAAGAAIALLGAGPMHPAHADPVAAYLAAPQSFTVQPVPAGDDFELVYQVPFDRYSADAPPLGIGQANVVFWARGLNSPWPVADAAAYHTQVAYFPGWLST